VSDIELIVPFSPINIELKKGLGQLSWLPAHVLSELIKSFINDRQNLAYHFLTRNRRELLQRYIWYLLLQLLLDNSGDIFFFKCLSLQKKIPGPNILVLGHVLRGKKERRRNSRAQPGD